MNRKIIACLLFAISHSGYTEANCEAGYGVPANGCTTLQYSICPNSVCTDFDITCAPTKIRRESFLVNEHARVIVAPLGATSVTIEFTESGMGQNEDNWAGVLVYQCLSRDDCNTRCTTLSECKNNLALLGKQSGWDNTLILNTFTSNTGAMILYWTVPSNA